MFLTIIIPTKNEEKNIGILLRSIQKSLVDEDAKESGNSTSYEVIVVDNLQTNDKTREIVRKFPKFKLIIGGSERSEQRNIGAKEAIGEYLLFLDADMEVDKELMSEILEGEDGNKSEEIHREGHHPRFQKDALVFVIPERIPGKSLYSRARNLEKLIYTHNAKISAARLYPREVFEKFGGYNEKMISGEDWDLDRRVRQKGVEIVFTENYLIHHEENLSFWGSIKKKVYYAKNLKNYKVGIQKEVNPIYRIAVLFSKPMLILKNPIVWMYLLVLKISEFGVGFVVYVKGRMLGD